MAAKKVLYDADAVDWTGITDKDLIRWRAAYPKVDIEAELRKAATWADANPQRHKSNWKRFLVNWIKRAESGNGRGGDNQTAERAAGPARDGAGQARRNAQRAREYPEPGGSIPRI